MKMISSSRLAVVDAVGMKKTLVYAALATASVMGGNAAQAATFEALTQYCPEGDVFIPSSKICAATLDTTVNGIPVLVTLNATTYHPEINQVEYNLLNPILVTIPGQDGDQVKLNKVSIFLDPVLKFEASFLDFADPSPFNLTFTSFPFAPTVLIKSSLSGSLTDGSEPQNGVSLTTPGLVKYDFLEATDSVADSFNLGSQVSFPGGSSNGSGDSHLYGPFSTESVLTCHTVGCGKVKLSLAFTGSGGGDHYDFSSQSVVTLPEKVPEPSATAPLALFGLVGLWGVWKRLSRH